MSTETTTTATTTATTTTTTATPPAAIERNNVRWIRDELVPLLAASGKLQPEAAVGGANVVEHIDVQQLSLSESFMLTDCYRIRVTLTTPADTTVASNGSADGVLQLVVKITPNIGAEMMQLVGFPQLFHNEVRAYTVLFPAFGWSDDYPRYYYSHIRPDGAAIALSDFGARGWRMARARVNLSREHILVAIAELGKLHGQMYALKHTDRRRFDELCGGLREARFVTDTTTEEWELRLRIGPQRAVASVRAKNAALGGGDAKLVPEAFLQRIESVLAETITYQKRVAKRQHEPLAVLCHGDYLRNNIAFKYPDAESDTPTEAMMFDFQTLRYASPMLDLVVFMVNSTGVAVRRPHFERIFDAYVRAVCDNFTRCTNIRATDDDYPDYLKSATFRREYALYLPYGLSVGASFLPILHEPDTTPFSEYSKRTLAFYVDEGWNRAGETLNAELRAIVEEMYGLYVELGLELEEEF